MTISATYLHAASIYEFQSRKRFVACVPFSQLSSDAQNRWMRTAEDQQERYGKRVRALGPRVAR